MWQWRTRSFKEDKPRKVKELASVRLTEIEARGSHHTALKTYLLPSINLELFLPDSDLKDDGQRQSAQRSENIPPISGLFFLE